jgi:hypothetical protein
MSTPVNASNNLKTPSLLTSEQLKLSTIQQEFTSPFLKADLRVLDNIRVLQPAAPASPESADIHGEDGSVIGFVSYTPGDFASMQAAAEKLMKEGNQQDFVEGQKLLNRAFQLLQIEMLMESLKQQIFNQAIQSLQRAAG